MDRQKAILFAIAGVMIVAIGFLSRPQPYCKGAEGRYGLRLPECPDGRVRQRVQLQAYDLSRTKPGTLHVLVNAEYLLPGDNRGAAWVRDYDVDLTLVDESGGETPVTITDDWRRTNQMAAADLQLPQVGDGDYTLRAVVRSRIERTTVELPVPLYAPAKIHVATDRPLYEPGNVVRFRGLAVRANDLSPIDDRPGTWLVTDPNGEVLLEERTRAGEWGVVAGSFPLDSEATEGTWTISWASGNDSGQRTFQVKEFTLPRFNVDAAADKPFYQPGEVPVLSGQVLYSSGAPVASADIEIQWTVAADDWPPPTSWSQDGLPMQARTGADGRFTVKLPAVPADLIGQARLRAAIAAVDPAGDRVEGAASVLLAKEAIAVSAITELGDGLVDGFNNRVYLRVTTADGRPLDGGELSIEPVWLPGDKTIAATLDEDSVARFQIDPGKPVNIVIPPPPVRRAARQSSTVRWLDATDLVKRESANLDDQLAMQRLAPRLERCRKWVDDGTATASVAFDVGAGGAVQAAAQADDELSRCAAGAMRGARLSGGTPRIFTVEYELTDRGLPSTSVNVTGATDVPVGVGELLERAALDARDCLPNDFDGGAPPLTWRLRPGARNLTTSWNNAAADRPIPPALTRCLAQRVASQRLDEPAEHGGFGVARFAVASATVEGTSKPQPTIMRGYELRVSASAAGKPIGTAVLRMEPGDVPRLRMRASPVLASGGDQVTIELIRGPDYRGKLPETITVDHRGKLDQLTVDQKQRTATLTLPADASGWYAVRADDAQALVYARADDELGIAVTPAQEVYAPGQSARLAIATTIAGKGAKAAVGLIGVDQTLGQLVPLPGPDDLGSLRPEVVMTAPAFDVLEGQALTLGRIRGANAAEATVLRIASIPSPAQLDAVVSVTREVEVDAVREVTEAFYPLLEELHRQVRSWEKSAPEDEQMTAERMVEFWNRTLDVVERADGVVTDAYGRRLLLHRLPDELLDLTDPRQVVAVGTRLPEDTEDWPWVVREMADEEADR